MGRVVVSALGYVNSSAGAVRVRLVGWIAQLYVPYVHLALLSARS